MRYMFNTKQLNGGNVGVGIGNHGPGVLLEHFAKRGFWLGVRWAYNSPRQGMMSAPTKLDNPK